MSTKVKLSNTFKICLVILSLTVSLVDCQRSYLNELKDAMYSLKQYILTLDGLSELKKKVELVDQFFNANIDEDCEPFICPKGYTRKTNPQHRPESNGCGFGLLPLKGIEKCCHIHDLCYDDCGVDKDHCDSYFKKCLYKVCSSNEEELSIMFLKGCKLTAKLMYTGTLALGCKAYQDAQNRACTCYKEHEL